MYIFILILNVPYLQLMNYLSSDISSMIILLDLNINSIVSKTKDYIFYYFILETLFQLLLNLQQIILYDQISNHPHS